MKKPNRWSRRQFLAAFGASGLALAAEAALVPGVDTVYADELSGNGQSSLPVSPENGADESAGEGKYEAVNVKQFGAVGDGKTDDSPAFRDAVEQIVRSGGGVLYIPRGNYRIARKISGTMDGCSLTVVGDGLGISNLFCDNEAGVFEFIRNRLPAVTTIRDLSLFASRPGAGTAIEISHGAVDHAQRRSLVIQHVEVRGADIDKDYFTRGIKVSGQQLPLFLNVIVAGPFGPRVSDDRTDDSMLYKAECGIQADSTTGPSFQHCYVWSAHTAYRLVSESYPVPQDAAFYRSFAVGCRTGIDISTSGTARQLVIDTCHVNCRDTGIRLNKRRSFSITNCLLYNSLKERQEGETADDPPYTDIQLTDCIDGLIMDNIFHQPFNNRRKMIEMIGNTAVIDIKDNFFNATGTAVAIGEGVSSIECANNTFSPEVTEIIDDSTASAVFTAHEFRGALLRLSEPHPVKENAWLEVGWSAVEYDTCGLWDGGRKLVVPKGRGIRFVKLTANVTWEDGSSGRKQAEFIKNGSPDFPGNARSYQEKGIGEQNLKSAVIPVKGGDSLGLRVRQSEGGSARLAAETTTWLSVQVING